MADRHGLVMILLLFCVYLVMVEAQFKNCYSRSPMQFTTNIPSRLRQNPFHLVAKGTVKSPIKGPFTIAVDVRKEWFPGFWSKIPCVHLGYKSCRYELKQNDIEKFWDMKKHQITLFDKDIDLKDFPRDLLKGRYKVVGTIWKLKPRKKMLGCVRGYFSLDVTA
ncbi:uncharacterized protein [Clytia hemisphaerica]|uniref:Uncharacterized protein n=1 Tax=Clytia hemisphaerica TaxID=252671 RepID=A0A7M5WQ48_9CNID|eukprot:TCONS_00009625-protein